MYQQIGDTIESLIAKIGFITESDFIIRQLYKERLTFTDFYVSLFYLFQCFFYEPLFYWFVNHKDDDDDDDDDACNKYVCQEHAHSISVDQERIGYARDLLLP